MGKKRMNSDSHLPHSRSTTSDWFRAISKPPPYRIGSTRLSPRPYLFAMLGGVVIVSLLIVSYMIPDDPDRAVKRFSNYGLRRYMAQPAFNATYPLSSPLETDDATEFRIAVVADLDERSKLDAAKDKWTSYLHLGRLKVKRDKSSASVTFDPTPLTLTSTFAQKGRGMELSELVAFDGRLYTCDDRTGIIFHLALENGKAEARPWVFLSDGPGDETKGFKCEWMTVKDKTLFVGGLGKEWTSPDGLTLVNHHPMFVKTVSHFGDVLHEDWTRRYVNARAKAGIHYPGYMIHEAGAWSVLRGRWFLLPRRAHPERYDDQADERHATNLAISADEDFTDISVSELGPLKPTHGFSSFKFIPGTKEELIVALKSKEVNGELESFVMVLNVDEGTVVMDEIPIPGKFKFEGVEFV